MATYLSNIANNLTEGIQMDMIIKNGHYYKKM